MERLKCKRTDTSATELPGVSLAPIQVVIGENKYVYYVPALLVLFFKSFFSSVCQVIFHS